jgi:hypothetical protein
VVLAGSLKPERQFLRELSREVRNAARGRNSLSANQLQGRVAWVKHLDPVMGRVFERELSRGAHNQRGARRRTERRQTAAPGSGDSTSA